MMNPTVNKTRFDDFEIFGFTLNGVRTIFIKELIQLWRDPYLMIFIILLPFVQLLVTGLAVERDINHIPVIVSNHDKRNASSELLKDFQQSTVFDLSEFEDDEGVLMAKIRHGTYRVGIIIPPDYSEKLQAGNEPAEVNVVVDGVHANIAKSIVGAIQAVVANHNKKLGTMGAIVTPKEPGAVNANIKVLYNPDLKTANYLVPGILAIIMHMMTILFTSVAIVRERETGTLEQLMVTPVRTTDLMLGKILPYAVIGMLNLLLVLGVMVWFFNIPITGGFWFLVLASMVFIMVSLGIGLIISISCQTQTQAVQLTTAIFLPSLLLSGFVFPIEPMPFLIKLISFVLPMTYYLQIIRGVVNKGLDFPDLWFPTLILLMMAAGFLVFSILRFRKQVA